MHLSRQSLLPVHTLNLGFPGRPLIFFISFITVMRAYDSFTKFKSPSYAYAEWKRCRMDRFHPNFIINEPSGLHYFVHSTNIFLVLLFNFSNLFVNLFQTRHAESHQQFVHVL